jgi:peroxin-14
LVAEGLSQRYILPLISPPTPPQLQQDKESIDEQFSRAFALLDQLSADTALLKSSEEKRTEHLDAVLREVENVVSELKSSSRRRDDETRRIGEEVRSLKDGIPKAIEGAREGNEKRLKELGTELRSLKVLLGNRLGSVGAGTSAIAITRNVSGTSTPATTHPSDEPSASRSVVNGASAGSQGIASTPSPAVTAPQSASTSTHRDSPPGPFSQLGKPATIPAWQMAAASKSESTSVPSSGDHMGRTSDDVAGKQQPDVPPI